MNYESKTVRLSGIAYESLVNGPGIRRVLFSQGCRHRCKGCFNEETHSFHGGRPEDMDELVKDILDNPFISGVTFSGGDPLEQADKFAYMAAKIRPSGKNIWCYTGYTFEYISEHQKDRAGWAQLLRHIDVLVDGKFEEQKKVPNLRFKGSSNQRIIDVQKTLELGRIVELNFDSIEDMSGDSLHKLQYAYA